jgi:hypothetical protein
LQCRIKLINHHRALCAQLGERQRASRDRYDRGADADNPDYPKPAT